MHAGRIFPAACFGKGCCQWAIRKKIGSIGTWGKYHLIYKKEFSENGKSREAVH